MKYTIILTVCLAAMLGSIEASRGRGDSHEQHEPPRGDLLEDIRGYLERKIANNATLLSELITALNSADLSQYVITVDGSETVNFTALLENYFTTLPALSSYIYTYILPSNSRVAPALNATLSVIEQLNTNQTVLMEFIGFLYIQDQFSYVSGSQGSYVVDFVSIQADRQVARILDQFIFWKVADLIHPNPRFDQKRRGYY